MQEITFQSALQNATRRVIADRDHPLTRVYRTLVELATRHHAILLIDGPLGAGKALCALAAADILGVPHDFLESHPDILLIPSDGRTILKPFVIETIAKVGTKATHEQRIIVWEDISRMHTSSANTFLKTLEEPEGELTFFMTAPSTEKILPTILSRSIEVICPTALFADVCKELLAQSELPEEKKMHIRDISFNSPALLSVLLQESTYKKQECTEFVEQCIGIAEQLLSGDHTDLLKAYAAILQIKDEEAAARKKGHTPFPGLSHTRMLCFIIEATIEKKLQSSMIPAHLERLRLIATKTVEFKRNLDGNMNTKLSVLDFVFGTRADQ